MVTIPELPAIASLPSDDDIMIIRDVQQVTSPDRRVTRGDVLHDVVRTGGDAELDAFNATSVIAETVTVTSGLRINHQTTFMATATAVLPATLAANTGTTVVVTVTSAAAGDLVTVGGDALPNALIMKAGVTALNTVTITLYNPTAGVLTLGQTVRVKAERLTT